MSFTISELSNDNADKLRKGVRLSSSSEKNGTSGVDSYVGELPIPYGGSKRAALKSTCT